MESWISELITAAIVFTLHFLFPYKPTPAQSALSYDELKKKYQKWEWFALIPLFTFLPLLTVLFGQIFQAQYQFELDDNPHIIYQILPESDMWLIPGMIMAFALIGVSMHLLYKAMLKDKYTEYTIFTNLKHSYDGMKVLRPMSWLFGVLAIISIYFITDYYIKIWNFKIEINDLKDTQVRNYKFDQIKKITYVAYSCAEENNNVIKENPHYHIVFKDNYLWDTSTGLHDTKRQPEIIRFLSIRSGIKPDTLGVD